MIDYTISKEANEAIKKKSKMIFRIVMTSNIIDRIIVPIYSDIGSESRIFIYSHHKKTYIDASQDGISDSTVFELKEMTPISSLNNSLYATIETLEKSGYKLFTEI